MLSSTFIRPALAVLGLFGAFHLAQAQTQMTPGLWDVKTTMKNAAMGDAAAKMQQMQQQMASMTPEQRQMVQQAMAGRGINISGGAGGMTSSAPVCISKEQAARNGVPSTDSHCQTQELSRSAGTVKYSFTCTGEHPMSGTGEFTMTSPTAYTMHSVSDTMVNGKSQHMDMDIAGTWTSADCGSVKPLTGTH